MRCPWTLDDGEYCSPQCDLNAEHEGAHHAVTDYHRTFADEVPGGFPGSYATVTWTWVIREPGFGETL